LLLFELPFLVLAAVEDEKCPNLLQTTLFLQRLSRFSVWYDGFLLFLFHLPLVVQVLFLNPIWSAAAAS